MNIPDSDTFGESGPKPCDKVDADDYHSLFEWEENNGDT